MSTTLANKESNEDIGKIEMREPQATVWFQNEPHVQQFQQTLVCGVTTGSYKLIVAQ